MNKYKLWVLIGILAVVAVVAVYSVERWSTDRVPDNRRNDPARTQEYQETIEAYVEAIVGAEAPDVSKGYTDICTNTWQSYTNTKWGYTFCLPGDYVPVITGEDIVEIPFEDDANYHEFLSKDDPRKSVMVSFFEHDIITVLSARLTESGGGNVAKVLTNNEFDLYEMGTEREHPHIFYLFDGKITVQVGMHEDYYEQNLQILGSLRSMRSAIEL